MTYLITFGCYGSRVPGEAGAVNHDYHLVGGPNFPECATVSATARAGMNQEPYALDSCRRQVVLAAILEVCQYRGWAALAVQVRSNHLHVVVDANASPELAMNTFKSYASRSLNAQHVDPPDRKRWARHESTRYLWTREEIENAIRYVLAKQGQPMAVSYLTEPRP
jgi:REP element-mobilizing transposase RayT